MLCFRWRRATSRNSKNFKGNTMSSFEKLGEKAWCVQSIIIDPMWPVLASSWHFYHCSIQEKSIKKNKRQSYRVLRRIRRFLEFAARVAAALGARQRWLADQAFLWKRNISTGDMILFNGQVGGQFLHAVAGPTSGLHFLCNTMEKIARHPWGSEWKPPGQTKRWN